MEAKNVVKKLSGYSWTCALGGSSVIVEKGVRRFEFHIRRKTGALQLGIRAVGGAGVAVPESWDDFMSVDSAWFVTASGDICNGNQRVVRSGKRLEQGDIVGVEVDMDHGILTFRKLPASLRKDHIFGGPCARCGVDDCLLWNDKHANSKFGYLGVCRGVMCYKTRVTLGNLPVGRLDAEGVWRHTNGKAIKDLAIEFMQNFSADAPEKVELKAADSQQRTATFEIKDAVAVAKSGRVLPSPLHRVLQVLVHPDGPDVQPNFTDNFAGSDVEASEQRVFLRDWLRRHPTCHPRRWDRFLAEPNGEEGLLVDKAEYIQAKTAMDLRLSVAGRHGGGKWGAVQRVRAGGGLAAAAQGAPVAAPAPATIRPGAEQEDAEEESEQDSSEDDDAYHARLQEQMRMDEVRRVAEQREKDRLDTGSTEAHSELDVVGPWIMTGVCCAPLFLP